MVGVVLLLRTSSKSINHTESRKIEAKSDSTHFLFKHNQSGECHHRRRLQNEDIRTMAKYYDAHTTHTHTSI